MSNSIIGFHIRSNGNGKIRKKIEEAIKLKCGYIQMFITKSVSYAKLPFSSNDLKYYDNNKDKIKEIIIPLHKLDIYLHKYQVCVTV